MAAWYVVLVQTHVASVKVHVVSEVTQLRRHGDKLALGEGPDEVPVL